MRQRRERGTHAARLSQWAMLACSCDRPLIALGCAHCAPVAQHRIMSDSMHDSSDPGALSASASGQAGASASPATAAAAAAGPDHLAQLAVIQDPKLRFVLELEFVEMLANPHYLHCQNTGRHTHTHAALRQTHSAAPQATDDPLLRCSAAASAVLCIALPCCFSPVLAQSRYLVDPAFLHYLHYLQYWHRPEYLSYLAHPHCLYFLELLLLEPFRTALLNPAYVTEIHQEQYWHWRSGRYNRYTAAEQLRALKQAAMQREDEQRRKAAEEQNDTAEQQQQQPLQVKL